MNKKNIIIFVFVVGFGVMLAGCEVKTKGARETDRTPLAISEDSALPTAEGSSTSQSLVVENTSDGSDPSKDELGWDGEWVGDGVSVIISDSDSGFPNVEFNDEAHNATLDEASIEGNTLTGVYRITWEMYADTDDVENLPEQEWTIVMVKDGGTASYQRETVLTWFNLNDDGTYGHTVTKENSASLQKIYKTEN